MLLGDVCPDLLGAGVNYTTPACWDQLTDKPYDDVRERETLLYATAAAIPA